MVALRSCKIIKEERIQQASARKFREDRAGPLQEMLNTAKGLKLSYLKHNRYNLFQILFNINDNLATVSKLE